MTMAASLQEAEEKARTIGRGMAKLMPEGWAFVLVMAEIGEGDGCTYISNVNREDSVKLLNETSHMIENKKDKPPMGDK